MSGQERARSLEVGAGLMAAGTAVSRVLGLVRSVAQIAVIGVVSQAANAFSLANALPNTLYNLLVSGVLSAVLVPQVVRAYKRDQGQDYVDRLLTLGFAALAALTALLTLAVPLIVRLYGQGGSGPRLELAIAFGYWTMPQIFFYGMYALLGQVLNARGSFGPFTWAPAANNVVAIAMFGVFAWAFGAAGEHVAPAASWTPTQIALLAGGATLGIVVQGLVLVPAMLRAGVRFRPAWNWRGVGLRTAGGVAVWTFVALLIGQLGTIAVTQTASAAPKAAGSVVVAGYAAWGNAFLIFMLPHSLVTLSLITALFPRMSGQAAEADHRGMTASISLSLRVVGLFTLLAAALGILLATPLVRAMLPSASTSSVPLVAQLVVGFMVGLPAFGVWSVCQRVYYAFEDARGLVPVAWATAATVALGTLAVRFLLPPAQWVVGATLATSASYLVAAGMTVVGLHRRLGRLDGRAVLDTHLRALLALVLPLLVGGLLLVWLRHLGAVNAAGAVGWVMSLLVLLVVGLVVGTGYVLGLRALHVHELDVLTRSAGRVLDRFRGHGRR